MNRRFTLEQRWEILKTYFQSECCVAETVRNLKRIFGANNAPTAPAVRKFVKKVRQTGMLIDNTNYSRVRPARSVENIAAVAESLRLFPKISIRKRSQQLNISRTSLRRILTNLSSESSRATPTSPASSLPPHQVSSIIAAVPTVASCTSLPSSDPIVKQPSPSPSLKPLETSAPTWPVKDQPVFSGMQAEIKQLRRTIAEKQC